MKKLILNTIKAILLVLPFFFQSCKVDLPKNSNSILKIEKSRCYGECPVYIAILKEKKRIEFYPKENTEIKKASFSKIKNSEFKTLLKLIESISIDSLKNEYDNKLLMDIPSTYLTFFDGKKVKKVKVRARAPEKLRLLIKTFEEVIKTCQWKPLPEDS
tara:strand:+ start:539 stop:1015 length:477 start_codon:yes stop_codon:yes gene_type:complete